MLYLLVLVLFFSGCSANERQSEGVAEKWLSRTYVEQRVAEAVAGAEGFAAEDSIAFAACGKALIDTMAADTTAVSLLAELMEHYLYNPNSPVRNEEWYGVFLKQLLSEKKIPVSLRERGGYQLGKILKNRRGVMAADFSFDIPEVSCRNTLHGIESEWTLLVFYDPECSHCTETLRRIAGSYNLNRMISAGLMTVLAIYAEGKREVWEKSLSALPSDWIVGFDRSQIVDRELYTLDAMPTLYLLDCNKNVVLKDPSTKALDRWLLANGPSGGS